MAILYLDHNATTPLDPEVRAEMDEAASAWGNPSSLHAAGQAARQVVERARRRVAALVGARPDEVVFTGGGTEADNLALLGTEPGALVITAMEHQAVMGPAGELERRGVPVLRVRPDAHGRVDPEHLRGALARVADRAPVLLSVMLANNDTGVIQAVSEIRPPKGVILHTDAVQAVGKMRVDVGALGVHLLSLSAHKIHGPKGVGALYVRAGTPLRPLVRGGHQERGLRAGTENVQAIAGFGKACALAAARWEADARHVEALRQRLEARVRALVPEVRIHGEGAPRLPNTAYLGFPGLDGEMLAIHLDLLGVAVSTGAACASMDREPSHVLMSMGVPAENARDSIRISLGRDTSEAQVDRAVEHIGAAVAALKGEAA